jgi:GPI ethanolamine phosphate transferase 1
MSYSVVAGIAMAVIGVLYLAYEDFVLSDFSANSTISAGQKHADLGRLLTGVQASP